MTIHTNHFGLHSEAFALTPDPGFLYLGPDHAEALAALKVGLESRRGLIAITAEVGMGKTTLLYSLLSELGDAVQTAYVANTKLPFDDLLRLALEDFGIETAGKDRLELLRALNEFLTRCAAAASTVTLVIDEAQNLDDETFENLRLLSNFDTFKEKLLQIVLVGQPELDDNLRKPNLRQVAERVAVRASINPLSRLETLRYIAHRLERAGGKLELFTRPALEYVVNRSRGVPRRINILCHNAMLIAYGTGAERVRLGAVRLAERERQGRTLVRLTPPSRMSRLWRSRRDGSGAIASRAVALAGALAICVFTIRWRAGSPTDVAVTLAQANVPHSVEAGGDEPTMLPTQRLDGSAPSTLPTGSGPSSAELPAPPSSDGIVRQDDEGDAPRDSAEAASEPSPASSVGDPSPGSNGAETNFTNLRVRLGDTLTGLVRRFYGRKDPELIDAVKVANPQLANVDVIVAGTVLRFPGQGVSQLEARGYTDE